MKLEINGKEYEVKFDYLAIREFSKIVGIKRPSELEAFWMKMTEDPSFEDMDNIAHLVLCSLKSKDRPEHETMLEFIVENPETLTEVFGALSDSTTTNLTKTEEDSKNPKGEKK